MAVYTDVTAEELTAFLAGYDTGDLLAYKGIAEGVENSNFLVHTSTGNFILTLYEKRVAAKDLPFFLGLMEHLSDRGINCPHVVQNRAGQLAGLYRVEPLDSLRGIAVRDGLHFQRVQVAKLRDLVE